MAITPLAANVVRYPATLTTPPYEKWILFEVRTGRHIGRTLLSVAGPVDATLKAVALYLPPEALTSSLEVSWEQDDDIGGTAEIVNKTLQQGGEIGADKTGMVGTGVVPTIVNTTTGVVSAAGAELAQSLKTAESSNNYLRQGMKQGLGKTTNPRVDMLYKSVSYRTHSFSFTLIPRNFSEALAIDDILNTFQYYMLPSFGSADTTGFETFVGFPYEFNITTFLGPDSHINKFDRSVLTRCAIDHASSTRVAFVNENGSDQYFPASTSLKLDFTEVRLQGRNQDTGSDMGKGVIWRGAVDRKNYPEVQ